LPVALEHELPRVTLTSLGKISPRYGESRTEPIGNGHQRLLYLIVVVLLRLI
jgi:hypothetical protein